MIFRLWRANTTHENANAVQEILSQKVLPGMESIEGHQGSYLLRSDRDGKTEFLTISAWDSLDAIRRFSPAGDLTAVVSPAVAEIVASYDPTVTHYEVVFDTVADSSSPGLASASGD